MNLVNKRFGTTFFRFVDEFFACDRKRLQKFCELILENNLKYQWFANSRVDALDYELLSLMKKSGCFELAFGFESGDEGTLSELNKQASPDKAENVLQWMKEIGIRVRGYIMFGFPWDTPESVGNTLRFLKRNDHLIDSFLPLTYYIPFPNTELFEQYAEKYHLEGWWLKKKILDRYATGDHMPFHHIVLLGDMKMRWKKAFFPLGWKTQRACRRCVDFMAWKIFNSIFPPKHFRFRTRAVLYSIAKISQFTFTWSTSLWKITMYTISRIIKKFRPDFPMQIY